MKKLILIFALATGYVANGFAQETISNLGVTTANPSTNPVNISQLEVTGRSITQNSFSFLPPGIQEKQEILDLLPGGTQWVTYLQQLKP